MIHVANCKLPILIARFTIVCIDKKPYFNKVSIIIIIIIINTRRLYADLPGHEGTDNLFTSNKRPDLVFATVSKIYIIELTVCFETNLISSRDYKISRYAHLKENCIEQNKEVELIFIELSSLGFYTENISDFKNFLKDLNLNPPQILDKCVETCIRCSYYIYNRRLKDWTIPELLLFV